MLHDEQRIVDRNSQVQQKDQDAEKHLQIDFDALLPTRSHVLARKRKDILMRALIICSFIIALIPLFSVLWTVVVRGVKRLNLDFLSHNMVGVVGGLVTPTNGHGGILHAAIGTVEITLCAMLIALPIGIMCAVYLHEYVRSTRLARVITMLVEVMSGIPSIVAGLFAYSLFSLVFGPGTINGFAGAIALSLLMLPTVVMTSVQMLAVVPQDLREASYALGVTQHRTIVKIVLRTALPGLVSGAILAIARVVGETAPLLLTAGYVAGTNFNIFSGQMTTLPVYAYQEYSRMSVTCGSHAQGCVSSIPVERAWAAALVLIVFVFILNLIGRLVAHLCAVDTGR